VLLLFSLMLTRAPIGREALDNQQRGIAALVGAGIFAGLGFLIQDAFSGQEIEIVPSFTASVGNELFSTYVLPFEVVSFVLLAALIGAIVLARKDEA
jgi:NADH-quinone oxidoreductase subunit J